MRSSRWNKFETSIFTIMSALARKENAINLAQGFPDFDGPDVIKEAAIRAMKEGHNQYCPSFGFIELRELIAARKEKTSGLCFRPEEEITVFSGATEAIFCSIVGVCEPGDEIVAFEPFYDSYPQAACAAGVTFKGVPLQAPDWTFSEAALEQAIGPKTKALVVNTPHNPTGRVFTRTELEIVARVAQKHDLIVIADEVYEEIIFKPAVHVSIAELPGMRELTITISSTSKTFSMTGWKIGYAFAEPELTRLMRSVHQATVFCSATPLQLAMIEAFKLPDSYYDGLKAAYQERRDFIHTVLNKYGFTCKKPDGSYFVLADYSQHNSLTDVAMAEKLAKEAKIASIPISVFFTDKERAARELRYLRFGFCKNMGTLKAADEKFAAYFRS